jgi:oligopeptide/dipeptide ABC transporter ATP-binding protein
LGRQQNRINLLPSPHAEHCRADAGRRAPADHAEPEQSPSGCRFRTRCPYVFDRCRTEEPALRPTADGQFAACHFNDLPAAQNPMAAACFPATLAPCKPDDGAKKISDLVLRSRALRGVSKDVALRGLAAILRDAVLRTAPQDEVTELFHGPSG